MLPNSLKYRRLGDIFEKIGKNHGESNTQSGREPSENPVKSKPSSGHSEANNEVLAEESRSRTTDPAESYRPMHRRRRVQSYRGSTRVGLGVSSKNQLLQGHQAELFPRWTQALHAGHKRTTVIAPTSRPAHTSDARWAPRWNRAQATANAKISPNPPAQAPRTNAMKPNPAAMEACPEGNDP